MKGHTNVITVCVKVKCSDDCKYKLHNYKSRSVVVVYIMSPSLRYPVPEVAHNCRGALGQDGGPRHSEHVTLQLQRPDLGQVAWSAKKYLVYSNMKIRDSMQPPGCISLRWTQVSCVSVT